VKCLIFELRSSLTVSLKKQNRLPLPEFTSTVEALLSHASHPTYSTIPLLAVSLRLTAIVLSIDTQSGADLPHIQPDSQLSVVLTRLATELPGCTDPNPQANENVLAESYQRLVAVVEARRAGRAAPPLEMMDCGEITEEQFLHLRNKSSPDVWKTRIATLVESPSVIPAVEADEAIGVLTAHEPLLAQLLDKCVAAAAKGDARYAEVGLWVALGTRCRGAGPGKDGAEGPFSWRRWLEDAGDDDAVRFLCYLDGLMGSICTAASACPAVVTEVLSRALDRGAEGPLALACEALTSFSPRLGGEPGTSIQACAACLNVVSERRASSGMNHTSQGQRALHALCLSSSLPLSSWCSSRGTSGRAQSCGIGNCWFR
jgi:hypothetical protein